MRVIGRSGYPSGRRRVTPEQVERENELIRTCLGEPRARPRLVPALTAVLTHTLFLSVVLPTASVPLPTIAPSAETPALGPTALPPPPERKPPREFRPEEPRPEKVAIPAPEAPPPGPLEGQAPEAPFDPAPLLDLLADWVPGEPEPPAVNAPIIPDGVDVSLPVLIESTRAQPRYPELARLARVEGKVILQAVIFKDGTVGEIQVLRTPGERLGFEEAAVEAVRRWRYRPALQDGRPVDVIFVILIDFRLR